MGKCKCRAPCMLLRGTFEVLPRSRSRPSLRQNRHPRRSRLERTGDAASRPSKLGERRGSNASSLRGEGARVSAHGPGRRGDGVEGADRTWSKYEDEMESLV